MMAASLALVTSLDLITYITAAHNTGDSMDQCHNEVVRVTADVTSGINVVVTLRDVEGSPSSEQVVDNGTAATLRRPSCVATSLMASSGSNTRPQPAVSQLDLTTDSPLLLLLVMSADDAVFADMTATHTHLTLSMHVIA